MKFTYFTYIFIIFITVIIFGCNNKKSEVKNKSKPIEKYSELSNSDGKVVIVKGVYIKYDPLPQLKRSHIAYLSGILLTNDISPQLFLEAPRTLEEQNSLNGRVVVVKGIFNIKQPIDDNEPEYAARYSGSWLYNIEFLKQ